MASPVNICNLAMSHIGEPANIASIDPPEKTTEAEACGIFYPMARDILLEEHCWNFATRRATLALSENSHNIWRYCYALPDDFIKAIGVATEETDVTSDLDYNIEIIETNVAVLYANHNALVLHYQAQVEESENYSPMFVSALSWLLASFLAGALIRGTEGMKVAETCLKTAYEFIARASVSDASQQKKDHFYFSDQPHKKIWRRRR